MSTQYRLVQSGKTASGGCSAGHGLLLQKVVQRLSQNNIKISKAKASLKKITIQIKLVGMSMNLQCTELHWSKCNGS
jgi:hypothetical protein